MNRRTFLKIVGGGIILSATAGISGCTSEMPAEAIAAWQGQGDEPDVRRWILSYAIYWRPSIGCVSAGAK